MLHWQVLITTSEVMHCQHLSVSRKTKKVKNRFWWNCSECWSWNNRQVSLLVVSEPRCGSRMFFKYLFIVRESSFQHFDNNSLENVGDASVEVSSIRTLWDFYYQSSSGLYLSISFNDLFVWTDRANTYDKCTVWNTPEEFPIWPDCKNMPDH